MPAGSARVTYWLQCYRHERYVAEAVRSVLAQTYEPLEVILSDDCSPDRTFDVIQDVVRDYRGPHTIVLHRSAANRDIYGHANEVLPLIHGEYFQVMGGDDVAEPHQIQALMEAGLRSSAVAAWSNHLAIDAQGTVLRRCLPDPNPYRLDLDDYATGRFLDLRYSGSVLYSRAVIDRFPALPMHLAHRGLEHQFGFRAALLGGKAYVPQPLMARREHDERTTHGENRRDRGQDPMVVHQRQVAVRLQVFFGCLDAIVDERGHVRDATHEPIARALMTQVQREQRRQREFDEYRRRVSPDDARAHSGWRYPPNGVSLVRELPALRCNVLAAECRFFAVPWDAGPIEACQLRNEVHAGVVSAWTERELLDKLGVDDAQITPLHLS